MSLQAIDYVRQRRDIPKPLKEFLKGVAFYIPDDGSPTEIYIVQLEQDLECTDRRIQQMQWQCAQQGWLTYTPTGRKGRNTYTLTGFPEVGFGENPKPASGTVQETRNELRVVVGEKSKPISGTQENPEAHFGNGEKSKPASPLFVCSKIDSLNNESNTEGEISLEQTETSGPLPDAALPFYDWLWKAGIYDPACEQLARAALDQGVGLGELQRARLWAKKLERDGVVTRSWQAWLVGAIQKGGKWTEIADNLPRDPSLAGRSGNAPPPPPRHGSRDAEMAAFLRS